MVRDPQDPSSRIGDPHQFNVWLTLGWNGDKIPTETGKLTRDALLKTTDLGLEYYMRVYFGPVQKALEREMARLDSQISAGRTQHQSLEQTRRQTPISAAISDTLGRADFPDYPMWDPPYRMVLKAKEYNIGGNVRASQAFLVTASLLTRTCAQALADYIYRTNIGADRALAVLKVAKGAGLVASAVLTVTGVVGVARAGLAAMAEGSAVGTTSEIDVAAEECMKKYIARNPGTELESVELVPGPKGSISGFVKGNHSYGISAGGWGKWP
jgi:hypothetical protein